MSMLTIKTKDSHSEHPDNPLFVDLDGTLVLIDTLWEQLVALLKKNLFMLFCFLRWILQGKAFFKWKVAGKSALSPESLPYNTEVLDFLRKEHMKGRHIVLATAADYQVAAKIADYLGIFSAVLASDGKFNLSGSMKLQAIRKYSGNKEFEYIGNAPIDLPIWKESKQAHIVNPSNSLLSKVKETTAIGHVFGAVENRLTAYFRAFRFYQWSKNLLIFVPMIMGHKLSDTTLLIQALFAFAAFGFCASATYIINDLLDIQADLQHPRKRYRPFASGVLSIKNGIILSLMLLVIGLSISLLLLGPIFSVMLGIYLLLTTAYSLSLKKIPVIDVLLLAGLYTHRVLSGGIATGVTVSAWLFAFSIFFFLSMAFVKRYTELLMIQSECKKEMKGRGYSVEDIGIIQTMGSASGYLSVLVLALYINSKEVTILYRHPEVLWLLGPCLLYWITRVWLIAHRGQMHDDPIVFAIKDKASYVLGILVVILMMAATF